MKAEPVTALNVMAADDRAEALADALREFYDWHKMKREKPDLCGLGHAAYIDTIFDMARAALAKAGAL